jgi:pimeloyl-ACP methyl ester carboxylesterase
MTMQSEEAAWASVPYNYGARCRATQTARIAEDIAVRLRNPFNVHAYRAHLYAASLHNTYGRLGRIAAPTLVVHGAEDRMIPVANAHLLAEGIPGAQLRILEESGHLYPTEEPDVDAEIGVFFESH